MFLGRRNRWWISWGLGSMRMFDSRVPKASRSNLINAAYTILVCIMIIDGTCRQQWNIVKSILPEDPVRKGGEGRQWKDCREVLSGVLWILHTGTQWADRPERYGNYKTVYRRFLRL